MLNFTQIFSHLPFCMFGVISGPCSFGYRNGQHSVLPLIYLSYEWVPKVNVDLFRKLERRQSNVEFEPWTPFVGR